MKKIQLLLLLLIVLLAPNVFAAEFNMNSYTSATKTSSKGQYGGTEFVYGGIPGQRWNLGTRYDGRLQDIITYFSYPFEKNTTYRFTYNMATNDFNNNFSSSWWWDCDDDDPVAHVFVPTYISYKKVQYSITPSDNTTCIKVQLMGKSNGEGITQIKNWNLSSITIYDPDYQSGSGSGQGTTPAATPNPNEDIINNQNDNTQDIINNQNENTSDIITSIQETTEQVSETITNTFTTCEPSYNLFDTSETTTVLNQNGDTRTGYFFHVPETGTYYLYFHTTGTLYWGISSSLDSPTTLVGSTSSSFSTTYNLTAGSYLIMWPTKGSTDELMIAKGSQALPYKEYGDNTCTNKIDDLNDKLDGLNRVIEDSQVDDKSSFFTGFQDNSHGLTGIITAPLTTIQGLANKSCVPLSIPIPYTNSNVNLPCMTQVYQTYVPTVFNIWQVVSFGIISYFICIDIFKMVKGFKDPNEDKVEVLDL